VRRAMREVGTRLPLPVCQRAPGTVSVRNGRAGRSRRNVGLVPLRLLSDVDLNVCQRLLQ
jgi:hypothetical protein